MKKNENYFIITKQINSNRKNENEYCPSSALEVFQFNSTLNCEWALSTMHIFIYIYEFYWIEGDLKLCAKTQFPQHGNSNIFQNCF